jgi:hypothetical protein
MSRAGIQQIAMCNLGSLATTPLNIEFFGLGGEKAVDFKPYKPTDLFPEKKGRNMEEHTIAGESEQATMRMIKNMIGFLNFNCDVQVITAKQTATADSEDVFKYAGADCLGLMFKYESSREKQRLTPTLNRAFEYDYSKTLKDAADSAEAVEFTGITDLGGRDFTLRSAPNALSVKSGSTELFTQMGIRSRSLILETIDGSRNQFNMPNVELLKATIELIADEASVAKIIELMGYNNSSVIKWRETTSGVLYKEFDFNVNVLTQTEEEPMHDKERNVKLVYEGAEWIYNTSFEFGTGKGGATDDTTGTTGGTMKFGY